MLSFKIIQFIVIFTNNTTLLSIHEDIRALIIIVTIFRISFEKKYQPDKSELQITRHSI